VTEEDFKEYVSAANDKISEFDMEIRSTLHQTSRQRIYALVNSTSDPMSQIATPLSPDEISFVKRVLDYMFVKNNKPRREVMAVKGMQAVQLAKPPGGGPRRETQNGTETQGSSGQGITISQAEKVLQALVDQGWFEKSRRGYYSLSPRALMELRGWLTETYNDNDESDEDEDQERDARPLKIKLCYACKDVVTTGQRCPNWRCQCRIHDICTNNFFTSQRSRDCPICKTAWTGEDFVGERADRDR
jgi:hypothetical protein